MKAASAKGLRLDAKAAPSVRPVFYLIGKQLLAVSAVMLLPLVLDLAQGNRDWIAFAIAASVSFLCGLALSHWCKCKLAAGLDLRQAFLLTPLS